MVKSINIMKSTTKHSDKAEFISGIYLVEDLKSVNEVHHLNRIREKQKLFLLNKCRKSICQNSTLIHGKNSQQRPFSIS